MTRDWSTTGEAATTVLVVEDDASLRALVSRTMQTAGYKVVEAARVSESLTVAEEHQPDLAVIDLGLPDGSGLELLHQLREVVSDLPIVVLTARDALDDRITGFALGADDYVTKPFAVVELLARVHAVLRRVRPAEPERAARIITVADLVMDDDEHVVSRAEETLTLTPTEYRLLRYLMLNPSRVLSRAELLDNVWGYSDAAGSAVVEKFISQVRKKVDTPGMPPLIHAVRGFGYALRSAPPSQVRA